MNRIIRTIKPMLPQAPKLINVAAYARVSMEKDSMLHSFSAQVSYYSALIQKNPGWRYVGVYADKALTGTKAERPEFQRLLADCRAGKIDMVITKSISRFARNTVTLLETVRELRALGIDIYFQEQNIHSANGDGELMLTILASYAQEESRSVSENCKWRIRNKFKRGEPTWFRVYGYRMVKGRLEIIPEEARVVRMIFQDYLSGMGRELILKKLLALGIPAREGEQWHESTISYLLSNERYVGDLRLQKFFTADHLTKKKAVNRGELPQYYVEGSHEPIIDRATFEAVQERMVAQRAAFHAGEEPRKSYPFTGILRCGLCGMYYRRKIASAGTAYAKPVWICYTFNRLGKKYCQSKQIPESILMDTTAKVLGLPAFDEEAFAAAIDHVDVTVPNDLLYHFRDGHSAAAEWQDHSRRNSWTPEMRKKAAEDARKRYVK